MEGRLSRMIRGAQIGLGMLLGSLAIWTSAAQAQPRSTTRLSGPERAGTSSGTGSDMMTVRRVKDPNRKEWFTTYFAEFTGPSADFAIPLESYSPFTDFWAPMALFQNLELGRLLDFNHKVGLSLSTNKPLQSEVLDKNYNYYSSQFTFFDPSVFLQANNLLSNDWSWVNTRFSLDLPMSEFSRKVGKVTTIYLGPVWNFRLPNRSWYASLNLDLNYNLYSNPQGWNRFSTGIGHSLGYFFSPQWHVDTTSIFDFALVSQGQRNYTYSTGSVDRLKVTLRYQPIVSRVQVGLFVIGSIYDRGLDRSTVGANTSLWF